MYSSAYVWAKIQGYLEDKLTAPVVRTWFDDVEVMEYSDDQLVIYSPDSFRKEMITKRAVCLMKDAVKKIFELDISVTVLGEEDLENYKKNKRKLDFLDFNPQFTFDKFVVGSSNRFAHAAALSVASTLEDT